MSKFRTLLQKLGVLRSAEPVPPGFTYVRDVDGCDDTFDVYGPDGAVVTSIPFWDEPGTDLAIRAEAHARAAVDALNGGTRFDASGFEREVATAAARVAERGKERGLEPEP